MTETLTPAVSNSLKPVVVTVRDLVKSYPPSRTTERVNAVKSVSFEVFEGEFFTLLGPSGCGKTTTLRSIAGLETPDSGEIYFDQTPLYSSKTRTNVPPNKRNLSMVFQSYAIWPHMTVFENVAFPLRATARMHRISRAEIADRVQHSLETVRLGSFSRRRATELSGGQQQRLALARALVADPKLMLLDEPLSNLDAKLRDSVRVELQRLQTQLGITSMYVTHDQIEALAMSTRIAVMKDGEIQQIGTPAEIYGSPSNHFVADFIGRSNFIEGRVSAAADGVHTVTTTLGDVVTGASDAEIGKLVVVAIRPERVVLAAADTPAANVNSWSAVVESRQFLGESIDYVVAVDDAASLQVRANPSHDLPPGSKVRVSFDPDDSKILSTSPDSADR